MGVLTRRHGAVSEICLDWPNVRNALGVEEGAELRRLLERANDDPSVGGIVLSANGKAFCAGGKLPEIVELARGGPDSIRAAIYGEFQGVFRAITESRPFGPKIANQV